VSVAVINSHLSRAQFSGPRAVTPRDEKNPGFIEKTRWGGFNWFNTGLIGFNGQNG